MLELLFCIFFMSGLCVQAQDCSVKPNQQNLVILTDYAGRESIHLGGFSLENFTQTFEAQACLSANIPVLMNISIWNKLIKYHSETIKNVIHGRYEFYIKNNYLFCLPSEISSTHDSGFNTNNFSKISRPFNIETNTAAFNRTLQEIITYISSIIGRKNINPTITTLQQLLQKDGHAWNIILSGHGLPSCMISVIAGLPAHEFEGFLNFLETGIKTNAFFYSSCHAGSKQFLEIYKNKKFSYPIILSGITESETFQASDNFYQHGTNYKSLLNLLKEKGLCKATISEIGTQAGLAFGALKTGPGNTIQPHFTENILQIRWPQTTNFTIIPIENIINSLPQSDQTKTEHYTKFQEKIIVLSTPWIDKKLELINPESVVSKTNQKYHYIKKISFDATPKNDAEQDQINQAYGDYPNYINSIPTTGPLNLFSFFNKMGQSLKSPQVFLIDTLEITVAPLPEQPENKTTYSFHTIMISLNSRTPSQWWYQKDPEIFYLYENQGYRKIPSLETPQLVSPHITQKYLKLFSQEKDKLREQLQEKRAGLRLLIKKPDTQN